MDSFRVGLGIHFGGASAQGNGELEDISKQADGVGEWINRENPKDKSGPEGEVRPTRTSRCTHACEASGRADANTADGVWQDRIHKTNMKDKGISPQGIRQRRQKGASEAQVRDPDADADADAVLAAGGGTSIRGKGLDDLEEQEASINRLEDRRKRSPSTG